MKNIISYSLYEQKNKMFDRSGHDSFSKEQFRYWTNIPFIYIVNNLYFNDFKTRYYVHNDLKNHQLYGVLDKLSELENFELEFIDKEQVETAPSRWRLKCLWDSDICFCRDTDSVMCPIETKCMKYFIDSEYWINNIRGIWQHNFDGAILMAGLCGFKSNVLKNELPMLNSFDDYLEFCDNSYGVNWGCDQSALIDYFVISRTKRMKSKILDFYIQPDFKRIDRVFWNNVRKSEFFNINSFDENKVKHINLDYINKDILTLSNSVTGWLGQPVDVRGDKLNTLLSYDNDKCKQIKNVLLSDNTLKNFYRI